jgi:DNA-binding NarL/FixJ family response regulator
MKTKTSPKKSAQSPLEKLNHSLWVERMKPVALLQKLTPMEQQICVAVWMEMDDKTIRDLIGLSQGTVRLHIKNIFKKIHVTSRVSIALAFERSLHNLHNRPSRNSPWRSPTP